MKHFRQSILKALLLVVTFAVSASGWADTFTSGTKLYVKPGSNWNQASATFKCKFYKSGANSSNEFGLTAVSGNSGYYEVTIPNNDQGDWDHVHLYRYSTDGNTQWDHIYNIPAKSGNNLITISDGTWTADNSGYTWGTYTTSEPTIPTALYLRNNCSNWGFEAMTKSEDGKSFSYTFTPAFTDNMVAFQFTTNNSGTWFNYNSWYPQSDTTGNTEVNPGTPILLGTAQKPGKDPQKGWKVTTNENTESVTVTVNFEDNTFTVVKKQKVVVTTYPTIYFSDDENNKEKYSIVPNADGTYPAKEITTTGAFKFRFYVKDPNNTNNYFWCGPGTNTNSGISLNAVVTTSGNNGTYTITEAGTYQINVSGYEATSTITFSVTGDVYHPETITLKTWQTGCDDLDNKAWTATGEDGIYTFNVGVYDYTKDYGQMYFRFNDDKNTYYADEKSLYLGFEDPKHVNVVNNLTNEDNWKFSAYTSNYTGKLTIELDLNLMTVTVIQSGATIVKDYYFAGDMNDWFSTYFDHSNDTDNNPKGNMNDFQKNKDAWHFEYIEDEDDIHNGYYKLKVPGGRLSGQFQILGPCNSTESTLDWSNFPERYYHKLGTKYPDQGGYSETDYKKYFTSALPNAQFDGKSSLASYITRTTDNTGGQNFHMDCNAVDNAIIYFKPGSKPDLMIEGDPVNFYVFYAATKDDDKANSDVKAKINSGMPNTNNYYLPGIKNLPNAVSDGNNGYVSPVPDHMNIDGVTLTKFSVQDFKDVTADVKNVIIDEVTLSYIKNGKLPNGMDIDVDNWTYVYVAKIPNGFENPAGSAAKYNLSLPEATREDAKETPRVIANDHVYYLPFFDGLHVHAAIDPEYVLDGEVKAGHYNWTISYRVYYAKSNAAGTDTDIYVQSFDSNGNKDGDAVKLYSVGNIVDTDKEDMDAPGRKTGWHEMAATEKHLAWGVKTSFLQQSVHSAISDNTAWNYHRSENASQNNENDFRVALPKKYAGAWIQFQLVGEKKTVQNSPARATTLENAPQTIYSYVPSKLSFDNGINNYPLSNGDVYLYVGKNSNTWTGIDSIETEETIGDVDATPVYYNLQGVRVAEPTKGIYIKVTGNKSEKVIF